MKLQLVPARTGLVWIQLGFQTFFKQPLAMMALFFMLMAIFSLVAWLPLVGGALGLILIPLSNLGFMAASRQASKGKFPTLGVFVEILRPNHHQLRNLWVLGLLYAVFVLAVMAVTALFDSGQLARLYLIGGEITEELILQPDFQQAAWTALILYIPLSFLFWHAPALVHWHHVTPVKSLFFSFLACRKNWRAFSVFISAWIGISMVTTALLSYIPELGIPAFMLIASVFFTSLYFTFRDSFEA